MLGGDIIEENFLEKSKKLGKKVEASWERCEVPQEAFWYSSVGS